jgi:hypothetical protein
VYLRCGRPLQALRNRRLDNRSGEPPVRPARVRATTRPPEESGTGRNQLSHQRTRCFGERLRYCWAQSCFADGSVAGKGQEKGNKRRRAERIASRVRKSSRKTARPSQAHMCALLAAIQKRLLRDAWLVTY